MAGLYNKLLITVALGFAFIALDLRRRGHGGLHASVQTEGQDTFFN